MLKGLCHEIRELWSCVLTLDPVSGFTQLVSKARRQPKVPLSANSGVNPVLGQAIVLSDSGYSLQQRIREGIGRSQDPLPILLRGLGDHIHIRGGPLDPSLQRQRTAPDNYDGG